MVAEKETHRRKAIIDDGMNPELVYGARFDGNLEIPFIETDDSIQIPKRLVPLSHISDYEDGDAVCFYEHDINFSNVLINPEKYVDVFKGKTIISPDCSLYRNAPLVVQIANVYKNRALGSYFQRNGVKVIPNVRWGGKWTFTNEILPEQVAFSGIERGSMVSIGTYGCCKGQGNQKIFIEGMRNMLEKIKPKVVLVYGAMPPSIFSRFEAEVEFVHYPDWISYCKGGQN